jgi:hypothetical protein
MAEAENGLGESRASRNPGDTFLNLTPGLKLNTLEE